MDVVSQYQADFRKQVCNFSPPLCSEHCSMSLQETITSTSALHYEGLACSLFSPNKF